MVTDQQCHAGIACLQCRCTMQCVSTHAFVLFWSLNVLSGISMSAEAGDTGISHGRGFYQQSLSCTACQGCQQSEDQASLACCCATHGAVVPAAHPTLTLGTHPPCCCPRHALNSEPTPQHGIHWGGIA